jgi:hypothetical protein
MNEKGATAPPCVGAMPPKDVRTDAIKSDLDLTRRALESPAAHPGSRPAHCKGFLRTRFTRRQPSLHRNGAYRRKPGLGIGEDTLSLRIILPVLGNHTIKLGKENYFPDRVRWKRQFAQPGATSIKALHIVHGVRNVWSLLLIGRGDLIDSACPFGSTFPYSPSAITLVDFGTVREKFQWKNFFFRMQPLRAYSCLLFQTFGLPSEVIFLPCPFARRYLHSPPAF